LDVSRYDLFVDLDFQGLKFKGSVGVTLNAERDVELNSVGLDVRRICSKDTNLQFNIEDGNLKINTGQFTGLLQVDFEGRIPDALAGIYRAAYDHTHIITTHFEAAQARRMFPCLDRPDAKAEFKLSVRIDRELEAISNMPIEDQKQDGDKKTVTFRTTPRMSTYLLYLGVGRFQTITSETGETEVIVATTPGKANLGRFAEAEARKALEFFNSYYKIPYALPKVHLIAVPEFPMGAMENWGAITFREILLLINENTSSRIKMRAAMAIAHELAHQWFGDLVTMKWWDDIWLNESFATYMAYKAVDHAHPEWRIWENFFNGEPRVESQAGAMERDSLRNTHPIHVQVTSPDEIEQIFDEISYGKGAHVLRMIDGYVGEESFREGVRRYLTSHAYSNARSDDLWSAIEEASGKPVRKIMSAWIRQPGFPIITPRLEDGALYLMQNRMSISEKPEMALWPVPLIIEVNGARTTLLMESREARIKIDALKTLRINPDRTGFYAVNAKHVNVVAQNLKVVAGIVSRGEPFVVEHRPTRVRGHLQVAPETRRGPRRVAGIASHAAVGVRQSSVVSGQLGWNDPIFVHQLGAR
jgi:tricorn protease interacting factor F2/3